MFIEKIKLTNFRKFANLELEFNKGLNLFVGPNDSGKTAIIDALKFTLGTASNDWYKIQNSDFYEGVNTFKIEVFLKGFSASQASLLLDWGGLDDDGNFCLKVIMESTKSVNNGFDTTIKAGTYEEEDGGTYLEPVVKNLIKSVYLKPLRNAEVELTSGRDSRLSQILLAHPEIERNFSGKPHELESKFKKFIDDELEPYFSDPKRNLKGSINKIFEELLEKGRGIKGDITIDSSTLEDIVKTLSLLVENTKDKKPGLGTSNLLLIAAELLLLEKLKGNKLGCALIEEIEAHIHPQGQLRLINHLEKYSEDLQIFVTSHSPNIASKVDIKNIFICRVDKVFPMGEKYTGLDTDDYKHLRRFLDVTKANLFFAKGLIFVEGIAEALIIPEIAKILGYDLDSYGISIININGLSFKRYLKAFTREMGEDFDIKISAITDRDGRVNLFDKKSKTDFESKINSNTEIDFGNLFKYIEPEEFENGKKYIKIKTFYNLISTLEYDLFFSCLSDFLIDSRVKLYDKKTKTDFVDEIIDTNKYKYALNLYKKIENNKGETAQELAEILSELPGALKKLLKTRIENDDYLKYIVEAIIHVIS